jgi:4-amino-4-deoxy-L-arabinose transferase-like glycosyltransferase
MKRRLFNILAAASIVLCVATAVLWVRSNWYDDRIGYTRESWQWTLHSVHGHLVAMGGARYNGVNAFPGKIGCHYYSDRLPPEFSSAAKVAEYRCLGFAYDPNRLITYDDPPRVRYIYYTGHRFYVPYWFALVLLAILPVARAARWRRQRRRTILNLCLICGYSLTANISGVCPECGTAIPHQLT